MSDSQQITLAPTDIQLIDPFPSIPPALLNSADIADYVIATQMIDPFDEGKLKSGSYEIPCGGEVTIWEADGKKNIVNLEKSGDNFILPSNSIAYIWLSTFFRLPDYIALRFNLKITQVHRGILLGTGPLVDPGFHGRLFIPLHNLTNNNYEFKFGEGLIWAEFTKLSPNKRWANDSGDIKERRGKYIEFPVHKRNLKPHDYIDKANHGNPIQSSIPIALQNANDKASKAQDSINAATRAAEKAEDRVRFVQTMMSTFGFITLTGIVVSMVSLFLGVHDFTANYVTNVVNSRIEVLNERIKSLEKDLDRLKDTKNQVQMEQKGE